MTIETIRDADDLQRAFKRLETIFQAEEGTVQAREREVLVTLIEAYESSRCDLSSSAAFDGRALRNSPPAGPQ